MHGRFGNTYVNIHSSCARVSALRKTTPAQVSVTETGGWEILAYDYHSFVFITASPSNNSLTKISTIRSPSIITVFVATVAIHRTVATMPSPLFTIILLSKLSSVLMFVYPTYQRFRKSCQVRRVEWLNHVLSAFVLGTRKMFICPTY